MQQRIKGQEVTVVVAVGSKPELSLTDITNFNANVKLETKQQGFLGEFSDRVDMVYTVTGFDMEVHLHSQDYLRFAQAIKDKAQRVTPDVVFNVTVVLQFPNGETPTVVLPDVAFGEIPLNVPARVDYVKSKVQGICSNHETIYG